MPIIKPASALDRHTNPPLVAGEIYRILYAEGNYAGYVGVYFVPITCNGGDIQYLEAGMGYDHKVVLARYNIKYQVVTLQEV